MPFNSRSKSATSAKKDADGCRPSSCRDGLVKMNFRSLTVAAKYPARFASFEGGVVVELIDKDPLVLQTSVFFGRSTRSKVLFATLPLNSRCNLRATLLRQGGRGCLCSSWVK
eukprot:7567-Pleurochrysis_carterae.AAC.1